MNIDRPIKFHMKQTYRNENMETASKLSATQRRHLWSSRPPTTRLGAIAAVWERPGTVLQTAVAIEKWNSENRVSSVRT